MRLLSLLILLGVAGCPTGETTCRTDSDCLDRRGDFGRCLETHCAFKDPDCTSDFRFDDSAGPDRNRCVPPEVLRDAGPPMDAARGRD